MRNDPWLRMMLVSAPACTTSSQRYAVLRSRGCGRSKVVSVRPGNVKSMTPVATRWTCKSYVSGPGGDDAPTRFQVNVGWAVSMTIPAGLLSDVSVAQAGTATGPITPLVPVSPLAAVASTRQNRFPALSAWEFTNVCAVVSRSTMGVASDASRPIRSRNVTGVANDGTVPTVHTNVGVIVANGPAAGNGPSGVTPFGKTAAAATSGRPQPEIVSGAACFVAVLRNAARSSMGSSEGCICFTSAALAASRGVANDVPSSRPT